MAFRSGHSGFRSGGAGGNSMFEGALATMIAKIEEIKNAPNKEKKRLIVRERDKVLTRIAVDIDMKHSHELKEGEFYKFQVRKKSESHNGCAAKRSATGFKSYSCSDAPEDYNPEDARKEGFERFGSKRGKIKPVTYSRG